MFKVICLVCSPRRGGNTEILVQEALAGAREGGAEVELLRIADLHIEPCDGCEFCHANGECKIKDDMQKIFPKIIASDGIVLGSPVYFWSVNSQAKLFIDRTYALRYPYHKLKNKVGGAIVVSARRGCLSALSVINNFFLGQEMIAAAFGVTGYGAKKGDVRRDEKAMRDARSLGKQICDMIRRIKS